MARNTGYAGGRTILIVDDSPIVLDVTKNALESAGYRVVTHGRAEGTTAVVMREQPDLVLLDVQMPKLSGDSLAGALTKANPHRSTIVVLHSSLPPDVLKRKAERCGAHGYIQKTDKAPTIVTQVAKYLEPAACPMRRTLLIDDDPATIGLYKAWFRSQPGTEFTDSAENALEIIAGPRPPSVVVCDILLPGMNGLDLYRRAMALSTTWRDRFLFVTGAGHFAFVRDYLEQNPRARCLHKPVDFRTLTKAITEVAASLDGEAMLEAP